MNKLSFVIKKYDVALWQLYEEVDIYTHNQEKILSMFPIRKSFHTGSFRQVSGENILNNQMKFHSGKATSDFEMVWKTQAVKFSEFIASLIDSIQTEKLKHTFDVMNDTCEAVGNKIDEPNKNFWDTYPKILEKLEIPFDANGKSNVEILMNSETLEIVNKTPPTDEQLERAKTVMDEKRRLFFVKKRYRRLR
jgi:hypothetical protein